jgi:endonuclease YncB( thermonuclease family)
MPKPFPWRGLLAAALLACLSGTAGAAPPPVSVLDGDTYEILIEGFPTRVQLANADTPETGPRARCAAELELGNRATAWVRDQVSRREVAVFPTGRRDKYRRTLAHRRRAAPARCAPAACRDPRRRS